MPASPFMRELADHMRPQIVRIGWSEFARRSGVERSLLYKNFGRKPSQCPTITTLERALACLGLELSIAIALRPDRSANR